MKKIFIMTILLSIAVGLFAQDAVKKIKIYGVSWNLRSRKPITIENLKQYSHYSLTVKNDYLSIDELFDDYKTC